MRKVIVSSVQGGYHSKKIFPCELMGMCRLLSQDSARRKTEMGVGRILKVKFRTTQKNRNLNIPWTTWPRRQRKWLHFSASGSLLFLITLSILAVFVFSQIITWLAGQMRTFLKAFAGWSSVLGVLSDCPWSARVVYRYGIRLQVSTI